MSVLNGQLDLKSDYQQHTRTSPTASSYHISSYALSPSTSAAITAKQQYIAHPQPQRGVPLLTERWDSPKQAYSGQQLPLPSFSTVTRGSASPTSPGNKDGRMDLSKMLH